jgi:hypothetical protein
LLAYNWLSVGVHIGFPAFEISIHAHPVHVTTAPHTIDPNDRYVILGLASHGTCVAPNALRKIDAHGPRTVYATQPGRWIR